jgi:prolyl-tRNA editing enzyme YbaK/EbsC (Cys-tRNA(Pro) deacylase)
MALKDASLRVARALEELGLQVDIVQFPDSTRTAQQAASAVGTTVGQIVKSLVFVADGEPILLLVSGSNRVDPDKVSRVLGKQIERADAETVRLATGFAIGGVPPVGHRRHLLTLIDRDLLDYERVWAAAGTPNAVFAIDPRDLVRATGGQVVDLKEN